MTNVDTRSGLLLINLGTPESPEVSDVRRYLQEFLMDPRVLDMPWWRRFLLVHLLILPRRPARSAESYRKVWTPRGSPLLLHGQDLRDQLRQRVAIRFGNGQSEEPVPVELAMRYGNPSVASAVDELRAQGVSRIVALPLYAQASGASTASCIDALERAVGSSASQEAGMTFEVIAPFYSEDVYLDVKEKLARDVIERTDPDLVLFSYHGLPVRQLRRTAPNLGCMESADCCAQVGATSLCYRAQCLANARLLAERLKLESARTRVSFQSRLGRARWIPPATDAVLVEEAQRGRRRVVVISGFVADCLETLEELDIAGRELWVNNGGQELTLVPAPNAHDLWADAVIELVRETLGLSMSGDTLGPARKVPIEVAPAS